MFQPGPYFMTEEDQDAAIGRMVTSFSQAKKRRAALMAEADQIGRVVKAVGVALQSTHSIRAFSDGDARHGGHFAGQDIPPFKEYPAAARVNELVEELRTVSAEIRQLRASLKDAGLSVE